MVKMAGILMQQKCYIAIPHNHVGSLHLHTAISVLVLNLHNNTAMQLMAYTVALILSVSQSAALPLG